MRPNIYFMQSGNPNPLNLSTKDRRFAVMKVPKGFEVKPRIEKGKALVLTGPQSCGKSALARQLAEEFGEFREIDSDEFASCFQPWMDEQIKTVIVNEAPIQLLESDALKAIISSQKIKVYRIRRYPVMVSTPNFIFCTNDTASLKDLDKRRFSVVNISAHHPAEKTTQDQEPRSVMDDLRSECNQLHGQKSVLVQLLVEADKVLSTLEPESSDEQAMLEQLRSQILAATAPHRQQGADFLSLQLEMRSDS